MKYLLAVMLLTGCQSVPIGAVKLREDLAYTEGYCDGLNNERVRLGHDPVICIGTRKRP